MIHHKLLILAILLLATAGLLFISCSSDEDDEDDYGEWEGLQDFLDAIPDADSLQFTYPGQDEEESTTTKTVGETAYYYLYTRQLSRAINSYVLLFLGAIDEITSYPPTSHVGSTYSWGPWVDPYEGGLTPVESLFEITELEPGRYQYTLSWREKDSQNAWTPIWDGYAERHSGTARRGIGDFSVDFDSAYTLDEGVLATGRIQADYDTYTDGREINVEYLNFYAFGPLDDMPGPLSANYYYHSKADETGVFEFDGEFDFNWDEYHGTQYAAYEDFWFTTVWNADGEGRTDNVVTGGDLAQMGLDDPNIGEPIESIDISECWGSDYKRDYYIMSIDLGSGAVPLVEEGQSSDCKFNQSTP